MVEKVKTITIIGAGIMGHALAIVFAKGGLEVFLKILRELGEI